MMRVLLVLALGEALIAPQRTPQTMRRTARSTEVTMSAGSKKILVLGGDGFCGWPTALHLSDKGHDVGWRRPGLRGGGPGASPWRLVLVGVLGRGFWATRSGVVQRARALP